MRVITLNVNGIRSAERKGLARWLARAEPWDVVCLQEIKAAHERRARARCRRRASRTRRSTRRERKGYAGVALYAKSRRARRDGIRQQRVRRRGTLPARPISRELTVISLYLPSGSSGPHRQASKFRFLDEFLPHLAELRAGRREIILCGDWNIAHQRDRSHELAQQPEELGLPARGARVADAGVRRARLRRRLPPRRPAARAVHVVVESRRRRGRRTSAGASTTRSRRPGSPRRRTRAAIYKNRRFSDHAPLIIDYDFELR